MSTALSVMRLQPLHKGHQKIIDAMLAENNHAYLFIGSANAQDEKNIFSFEQRKSMVEKLYQQEIQKGTLTVLPINDIHNPPKWVEHIMAQIQGDKPTRYYCGSGQDGALFAQKGFEIRSFDRNELNISATMIRDKISNNDSSWENDVPQEIIPFIQKNNFNGDKKTMDYNKFSPLFCDLYHLTMAQAMFDEGTHERNETYEMFIRKTPFEGSYLISAGLGEVLQWLDGWKFDKEHIQYLRSLEEPKFSEDFLEMLQNSKLQISMDAIPEGEAIFPNEPIARVTGPAWQATIIEAGILNIINSQSLIATKASRITLASGYDGKKRSVLELGLRRAQAMQGFTPTRAAYIGGIDATSNVEAGYHYGIPVAGTMAHCFIMRDIDELSAFKKYLKAFPSNGSVLIDTYDTIEGVRNAIKASDETGIPLKSVRLDSGDLAFLSKEVRKILDNSRCNQTKIVASNDLDEKTIKSLLIDQKAPIDIFGVGTMLVTAYDQPALGGVYKIKETGGRDVIKISENAIKTTIPGATDVIRIIDENGRFNGDIIIKKGDDFLQNGELTRDIVSINLNNDNPKIFRQGMKAYRPLSSAIVKGRVNPLIRDRKLTAIREQTFQTLSRLDPSHLRFEKPHIYVAGLEKGLYEQRHNMRQAALEHSHNRNKINNTPILQLGGR